MRVFVTGASGYVGDAVARGLVRGGHVVAGLSRSEARDAAVRAAGAEPVRGELGAIAKLGSALQGFDAFVHAAMDYGLGPPADREAIDALLAAARAAGRPMAVIYTSGVWVLGEARAGADESAPVDRPAPLVAWRVAHERVVLEAASGALATAVIRPGMVYGERRGLVSPWFEQARSGEGPQVVGGGDNHWTFIHRDDLAELYRLVLERRARGVFHGVDGASTVREAAQAASAAVGGGAVRSLALAEARKTLGPVADAFAMDQLVVTARGAEVGWRPRHPPFVEDAKAAAREFGA